MTARRKQLEAELAALARWRDDASSAAAQAALRAALGGRSSHLAAAAAEIIATHELAECTEALVAAFERMLIDPLKTDPACAGKAAIADALYRIGAPEVAVYLRGIRHVQMEPVWGGKADTATGLRGTCGLALVRIHYHDYLNEIAELLADAEAPARRVAAQALAYSENPAATPLLRLKALSGDADPQVLGECLLALLRIAPAEAVPFVARFLDKPDGEIADAAALALGTARAAGSLAVLTEWWERTLNPERRRSALLAIALLKHDDAIAYLLGHVRDSAPLHAAAAIDALAVYRHDPRLREQVAAAVEARADAKLRRAFEDAWDGKR